MAKRRYALAVRKANLFYQFSPEAFLLTALFSNPHRLMNIAKKRKGLSGRAAGSLACEVAAIGLT
ncbi:hypothetical protein [Mucilaginibacter sp. UR6-11]|uniref:hypothetical protein n=1 Tax=Mucilaginibacter sp. UR6-11 TaxID=1435644 RepID=UPI001E302989|nr:hypothetical protein [Mucilaginibacter sp. UR6-11]MCC8426824.1 hypothetical protein [Mucilaginibacter sp. UR6-11]